MEPCRQTRVSRRWADVAPSARYPPTDTTYDELQTIAAITINTIGVPTTPAIATTTATVYPRPDNNHTIPCALAITPAVAHPQPNNTSCGAQTTSNRVIQSPWFTHGSALNTYDRARHRGIAMMIMNADVRRLRNTCSPARTTLQQTQHMLIHSTYL